MNATPENDLLVNDPKHQSTYTLEVVAKITGVSSQMILRYQEHGLIRTSGNSRDFDDEAVRTLRRIEHLRQNCEANLSGIKLILDLIEEVDRLKASLRSRRKLERSPAGSPLPIAKPCGRFVRKIC